MKTKFGKFVLVGCCLWISAEAQGQTLPKFWLNSSLGAHEKAAYQKAADEYSQKNPNVKVTLEAVPWIRDGRSQANDRRAERRRPGSGCA